VGKPNAAIEFRQHGDSAQDCLEENQSQCAAENLSKEAIL
jgi:hypothetical protein